MLLEDGELKIHAIWLVLLQVLLEHESVLMPHAGARDLVICHCHPVAIRETELTRKAWQFGSQ